MTRRWMIGRANMPFKSICTQLLHRVSLLCSSERLLMAHMQPGSCKTAGCFKANLCVATLSSFLMASVGCVLLINLAGDLMTIHAIRATITQTMAMAWPVKNRKDSHLYAHAALMLSSLCNRGRRATPKISTLCSLIGARKFRLRSTCKSLRSIQTQVKTLMQVGKAKLLQSHLMWSTMSRNSSWS